MRNYLKKRDGGALVMVILVMMIMVILGTALLSISLNENKQASRENNRIEAYYLARSGVAATAAWILGPDTTPDDIAQIINKKSDNKSYGKGNFNVEVIKDPSTEDLVLVGTGTVNGVSNTTRMIIEKSSDTSDKIMFDYSIYLMNNVTFTGNVTINGSLGHPDDVTVQFTGNSKLTGLEEEVDITYTAAKIPVSDKTFAVMNPSDIFFTEEFNTIEFSNGLKLTSGNDLTIHTGSGSGEVNLIIAGDFIFGKKNHSDLVILGDKRLNIYVTGNVDIISDINNSGSPQKLLFLMDGSNSFNLASNVVFNGFIYAPNGSFKSQGNAMIKGAIIAKNVELGGTPFADGYLFNPDADNIEIPLIKIYSKGTWLDW